MVREAAGLTKLALIAARKPTWPSISPPKPLGRRDMCLQTTAASASPRNSTSSAIRETRLYTVAPISTNWCCPTSRACIGAAEVVLSNPLPSPASSSSRSNKRWRAMCSCRLADAGARVIKIERPEGDFARGYDALVHGECSYFVWLNRGKESVVLDLGKREDRRSLPHAGAADVFLQNLKPGAVESSASPLRIATPISTADLLLDFGLRRNGPHAKRKAYDMLIQAESALLDHRHRGAGAGWRFGGRYRVGMTPMRRSSKR